MAVEPMTKSTGRIIAFPGGKWDSNISLIPPDAAVFTSSRSTWRLPGEWPPDIAQAASALVQPTAQAVNIARASATDIGT
jgi:hypothetical protein